MATQPAAPVSGLSQPTVPLAIPGSLALLLPVSFLGAIGWRAAGAQYGRGADEQLNTLGTQLAFIALVAAVAVLLSLWPGLARSLRRTLVAFAVGLTIFGLAWGIPAEAHGRSVAHNCACEGG
jgi:hypothetical protein